MPPTLVVLITGHPSTGKSRLADHLAPALGLPLICKDDFKEPLLESLGASNPAWSDFDWSRKLSAVSWTLLYGQVEVLLKAGIGLMVEGNFDPAYANAPWQSLCRRYPLRMVQVLCHTDPDVLLARYRERIKNGERHPGHVDQSDDPAFLAMIRRGPLGWLDVDGERLLVDTTALDDAGYAAVVERVRGLVGGNVTEE